MSQLVFKINNRDYLSELSSKFAQDWIGYFFSFESVGRTVGKKEFLRDLARRNVSLPVIMENDSFGMPVKIGVEDGDDLTKLRSDSLDVFVKHLERHNHDLYHVLDTNFASGLVDGSCFPSMIKYFFISKFPASLVDASFEHSISSCDCEVFVQDSGSKIVFKTNLKPAQGEGGEVIDNRLAFDFLAGENKESCGLVLKVPVGYECSLESGKVKVDFDLPPDLECLFYSENLFKWLSVMEGYFELSEQSKFRSKDHAIANIIYALIQDKDASQLEPWLEDKHLTWFELVSLYSKCLEMPDKLAALREMIEERFTKMLEDGEFSNISDFSDAIIGRYKLGSLEDGVSNYVRRLSEIAMRMCKTNSEDLTLRMMMQFGSKAYDTNQSFQQSYSKNVFMAIVFITVALPMMFKWMMSGSKTPSQDLDEQEQEYGREPSEVVQSALNEASLGGNVLPFYNHNGCGDEAQGANDYLAGLAVVS